MASAVIHMAVANEINKKLKRNNELLLIGSISPDISKCVGENKVKSHFLDLEEDDIPNIDRFLAKYKEKLNDDFVLGYFIHLYTDYLWFKYFVPEFYEKDIITKLDGTSVKCIGNMARMYIYNDYTNLNTKLLENHKINLDIFYKECPYFENIIEEIPMEKIPVLIDFMRTVIKNSSEKKILFLI